MTDNRSSLFFFGLGLGVVGALLLAPKSGVQTRAAIVDKAKEGQVIGRVAGQWSSCG